MRIPRDLSGRQLAHLLDPFGYRVTREVGSHLRLTTDRGGEHHLTLPDASSLRIGTLSAALSEVARHLGTPKDELLRTLFQ